jgi:hypothetical protein
MQTARRTLWTSLAVASAALALAAPAHAATQTREDAADVPARAEPENDVRKVSFDVTDGGTTTVTLGTAPDALTRFNRTVVFIDTDADGRSDRAVELTPRDDSGTDVSDGTLMTTPSSVAGCQRTDGGSPLHTESRPLTTGADGLQYASFSFPTSALGTTAPTRFHWAVYAKTTDLGADAFDHVPDTSNAHPERANPVSNPSSGDVDGCDVDRNGTYEGTTSAGYFPVATTGGTGFPDGATDPNGAGGSGGSGQGSGGGRVENDTDGDGLSDPVERSAELKAMGADPRHKDLFVEVDHMAGHKLDPAAAREVKQAFTRSPVPNPDGKTGINLHLDNGPDSIMNPVTDERWGARSKSNQVAHRNVIVAGTVWDDFDKVKKANQPAARRNVFRYALMAHQHSNAEEESGGRARGIPASDLVVTLGRFCAGTLPDGHCIGTTDEQAGFLMHELGHTLGLGHGGDGDVNDKPNYMSVMNYTYPVGLQYRTNPYRKLDYSRWDQFEVGNLNETGLNEQAGLAAGDDLDKFRFLYVCKGTGDTKEWQWGRFNRPVDWDCGGSIAAASIFTTRDVNGDAAISGADGPLTPFDDWANISFTGGWVGLGGSPRLPRVVELEETLTEERMLEAVRAGSGDTKRPRVAIRRPRGKKRRGAARLSVVGSDDQALRQVSVFVDGKLRTTKLIAKPARRAQIRLVFRRGRHRVRAVAYDAALQRSKPASARVRVRRR